MRRHVLAASVVALVCSLATGALAGGASLLTTAFGGPVLCASATTGQVPQRQADGTWAPGTISVSTPSLASVLAAGNTTSGHNVVVTTGDGIALASGTASANQIKWGTGGGSVVHLQGPSDTAFQAIAGPGQALYLGGGDFSGSLAGDVLIFGGSSDTLNSAGNVRLGVGSGIGSGAAAREGQIWLTLGYTGTVGGITVCEPGLTLPPQTATSPGPSLIVGMGGNGSNVAGADLRIAGGQGTGSANGGNVVFQGSSSGGPGSSLRSLSTVATLSNVGALTLSGSSSSYVELPNQSSAAVSGASTGRLRYNNSSGNFEVSTKGGSYTALATAGSGAAPFQNLQLSANFTVPASDNAFVLQKAWVVTSGSGGWWNGTDRLILTVGKTYSISYSQIEQLNAATGTVNNQAIVLTDMVGSANFTYYGVGDGRSTDRLVQITTSWVYKATTTDVQIVWSNNNIHADAAFSTASGIPASILIVQLD